MKKKTKDLEEEKSNLKKAMAIFTKGREVRYQFIWDHRSEFVC